MPRLNERNLRPIVGRIDWHEQRRLFRELTFGGSVVNSTPTKH
jgi:hypothetical protein